MAFALWPKQKPLGPRVRGDDGHYLLELLRDAHEVVELLARGAAGDGFTRAADATEKPAAAEPAIKPDNTPKP